MNTWLFEVNTLTNALMDRCVKVVYTPFPDVASVFEGREFKSGTHTSKFVVKQLDGGGYVISIENVYENTGYEF